MPIQAHMHITKCHCKSIGTITDFSKSGVGSTGYTKENIVDIDLFCKLFPKLIQDRLKT